MATRFRKSRKQYKRKQNKTKQNRIVGGTDAQGVFELDTLEGLENKINDFDFTNFKDKIYMMEIIVSDSDDTRNRNAVSIKIECDFYTKQMDTTRIEITIFKDGKNYTKEEVLFNDILEMSLAKKYLLKEYKSYLQNNFFYSNNLVSFYYNTFKK